MDNNKNDIDDGYHINDDDDDDDNENVVDDADDDVTDDASSYRPTSFSSQKTQFRRHNTPHG